MAEEVWIQVEPGVIALSGSPFSIRYRAGEKKPFALHRDGCFVEAHEVLSYTKLCARWLRDEMAEMGVLP